MGLSVWPGGIFELLMPQRDSGATEQRGDTKRESWRAETQLIYNRETEDAVGDEEIFWFETSQLSPSAGKWRSISPKRPTMYQNIPYIVHTLGKKRQHVLCLSREWACFL